MVPQRCRAAALVLPCPLLFFLLLPLRHAASSFFSGDRARQAAPAFSCVAAQQPHEERHRAAAAPRHSDTRRRAAARLPFTRGDSADTALLFTPAPARARCPCPQHKPPTAPFERQTLFVDGIAADAGRNMVICRAGAATTSRRCLIAAALPRFS